MTNFINLVTVFTTALALTTSSVSATTVYVDKSIDTTDEIVVEYDYGVVEDADDEIEVEDEFTLPDVDTEDEYIEIEVEGVYDEDLWNSLIEHGYISFEEDPVDEDVDNDEEEWYDDYEDEEEDWSDDEDCDDSDDYVDDTTDEELTKINYALEHLDEFEHWEVVNGKGETELHIIIDGEEYILIDSCKAIEDVVPIEDPNDEFKLPPTDNNDWVDAEINGTVDEEIENTY